jgi:hypothetical protein
VTTTAFGGGTTSGVAGIAATGAGGGTGRGKGASGPGNKRSTERLLAIAGTPG